MQTARWPLAERAPALIQALDPLALCDLPTPVEPLQAISPRAFIKRDDVTSARYGGNKMRKLELVAAEWVRRDVQRVVTFGGTGTNAGVATALVAGDLGIACEILTFDQPPSPTVDKNAARMRELGAHVRHMGPLPLCALAFYAHPRRLDPRTSFLFAGCSSPIADLAYVNAALELDAQVRAGLCPAPAEIVVAAGTTSTVAGLTLGCALAGLSTRVVGVRVAPARVLGVGSCTAPVIARRMEWTRRLLSFRGGLEMAPPPGPVLLDGFYGPGYGASTSATDDAVTRARAAGAGLEQTYTGKAFAAFLERLEVVDGPVLFWNTYSAA